MNKLLQALFSIFTPSFMPFGPSKRTVDGALVHFRRAIDELVLVEEQEVGEVNRRTQEIQEAQTALEAARKEASRARNKRAKISALIGEDEGDESTEVVSLNSLRGIQFDTNAR